MYFKKYSPSFSSILIKAIVLELSLEPKPGLITPVSVNSHKDMDFFLMSDSHPLLYSYFEEFEKLCSKIFNISDYLTVSEKNNSRIKETNENYMENALFALLKNNFATILSFCRKWELQLIESTGYINTYKGIIFNFAVIILSVYFYKILVHTKSNDNLDLKKLQKITLKIGQTVVQLKNSTDSLPSATYGARLRKNGIPGDILYQAENGYSICFDRAIIYGPLLKNFIYFKKNIRLHFKKKGIADSLKIQINQTLYNIHKAVYMQVFFEIFTKALDGNIAGKKSVRINRDLQKYIEKLFKPELFITFINKILHSDPISFISNHRAISKEIGKFNNKTNQTNNLFIKLNVSPGGTADLFLIFLVLNDLHEQFKNLILKF